MESIHVTHSQGLLLERASPAHPPSLVSTHTHCRWTHCVAARDHLILLDITAILLQLPVTVGDALLEAQMAFGLGDFGEPGEPQKNKAKEFKVIKLSWKQLVSA